MKFNKVIFILATMFFLTVFSSQCFAEMSSEEMRQLRQNTKLNNPSEIMQAFEDGGETVNVIIMLQPAELPESRGNSLSKNNSEGKTGNSILKYDLKNLEKRTALRNIVKQKLDKAIQLLDTKEIKVKNRFTYIFGFSATVSARGLQNLVERSEIISIEQDAILYPHLAQGVPLINADTIRSTYDGSGLSIAICDTGIDTSHPMLGNGGSSIFNSKVIGGYDTGDNDADPRPDSSSGSAHGTACAGIAAGTLGAVGDYIGGVAPGAKLYAVKISYGNGGSAFTSDMVEGWEWCITHQNDDIDNPIMIISTSFGGGRFYSACDGESSAMTTAAANAVSAGMTIFVSSGNDGFCDATEWPACISHVISVGAVYDGAWGTYYPCVHEDSCAPKTATTGCASGWYATDVTAADNVTSYSNSASFLTMFAPSNQACTTDIVGNGGYDVTGDYVSSFGGTSAACPYAAGAAAVLQHAAKALKGNYLTPEEVKSYLINYGNNVTDPKVAITKPRINLENAVTALGSSQQIPEDGGFEYGPPPSSAWTETLTANQGGSRIGAWSGTWGISMHGGVYCWWGGGYFGNPETNTVSQTFEVPAGSTFLKFFANFYRPDDDDPSPEDLFYVMINGTTVYSKFLTKAIDTYPNWKRIMINISSYGGQNITLKFGVTSVGDTTGNVLIDDIEIGRLGSMPAIDLLLLN